jgi:hypothetical protein
MLTGLRELNTAMSELAVADTALFNGSQRVRLARIQPRWA